MIHDEVDWAATQAVRRQRLGNVADDPEVGDLAPVIEDLAEKARAGRLVLFTGAGISIPAGLPDWRGLLAELATDVVSDDAQAERLAKMDVLDQAAVVASRIGQAELVGRVVRSVSAPHHAPAHGLLASLGVRENVTLNYDELFEMAAGDAGSPVAVLPYEPAEDRWLLKLHGCASKERQRDIVLTRSDYLSLGQHRATLTGLIQALLVTRHMLFVGFGLADDHFHAVVHDVRRSLGDGARGRFGTALVLERDELLGELWGKDLRLVPMDADSTAEAARKLELVLDRLLLLTTTSDRHLFDPAFEGLLSEDERDLRDRLLVTFGHHRIGQGSSWQRVERVLADLGWKGRAR